VALGAVYADKFCAQPDAEAKKIALVQAQQVEIKTERFVMVHRFITTDQYCPVNLSGMAQEANSGAAF